MAGAIDATLRKFHASLNVSDLERSIAFYRALLGAEPAKVRSDYAKFDLADPPLVLSLVPNRPGAGAGGPLNHAGLRMRNAEELVDVQRRLEAAGMPTQREEGVECCYARQTKFWIADPDGALWEIYVFHEDIDDHGEASPPRAEDVQIETKPAMPLRAWVHHLRDAIPARIPHDDNTLQEVRLEGSFNVAPETENRAVLLAEALRTLRPEAAIHLHGLAGDRACTEPIALPGPAAAVRHVPAVSAVADELARAGFVDIRIDNLSETAFFVVAGVPTRELRITARKPGYRPKVQSHQAVYLGPMRQVEDDFGTVLRRGVPTAMNIHDWQVLARSAAGSSFLFLKPGDSKEPGCCSGETETPTAGTAAR